MKADKMNPKESLDPVDTAPLRGTWLSVSLVGAVILITYIVLFGLYMARV
jgi:hypothetical protein